MRGTEPNSVRFGISLATGETIGLRPTHKSCLLGFGLSSQAACALLLGAVSCASKHVRRKPDASQPCACALSFSPATTTPIPSTKDGAWRHYVGQIMVKGGACLTVGWTQPGDEELVCLSSCGHMSQKHYRRGRLQTKALL